MLIDDLRKISNPYYITSELNQNEFVGRDDALKQLRLILEDYNETLHLTNIIIKGEKAIGKSTLLHRYKQILSDYNFITYEEELPRNKETEIDEFEFIKNIIDHLFNNFGPEDGYFFDTTQSEIWFSLTSNKYDHDSTFLDREIEFATKYANTKRNINENLSHNLLLKDFKKILDELLLNEMDVKGFAILIDEFQELSRNTFLIDALRLLSEKLTGLIIIGACLPSLHNNPSFEKFSRTSKTLSLSKMDNNEIENLIFKPLEIRLKSSRHKIRKCFNLHSIYEEIVKRSDGNPLHVRILCRSMFDHFQSNANLNEIILNREVMDNVMEYYATNSEESSKIKKSLQHCSRDQLESFKKLYLYEGLSIGSAIMGEIAFESLQKEKLDTIRKRIINDFIEINDLGLFKFTGKNNELENIKNKSTDQLSGIEYKFIGDTIDKLYASYYYEDITNERLIHHGSENIDDFLIKKLTRKISSDMIAKKIQKDIIDPNTLIGSKANSKNDYSDYKDIENDLNKLLTINNDKYEEKAIKEEIADISRKHRLEYPSIIAAIFEYEGYYLLISDVTIKGKEKVICNLLPIKRGANNINEIRRKFTNNEQLINASLDEYLININWIYLYFLPKKPLLFIQGLEMQNEKDFLNEMVRLRKFEEAVESAGKILTLETRIRQDYMAFNQQAMNNYAFCLININSLIEAKSFFEKIKDKYIMSKINLAYILFMENDWRESVIILKRVLKKLDKKEKADFMHLALKHEKMPNSNKIIEDPVMFNTILWNLALINSFHENNSSITFSYYKKVKPIDKISILINKRVRSWIDYNLGDVVDALNKAKNILDECPKDCYLYNDILKDIEIFS